MTASHLRVEFNIHSVLKTAGGYDLQGSRVGFLTSSLVACLRNLKFYAWDGSKLLLMGSPEILKKVATSNRNRFHSFSSSLFFFFLILFSCWEIQIHTFDHSPIQWKTTGYRKLKLCIQLTAILHSDSFFRLLWRLPCCVMGGFQPKLLIRTH